MDDFYLYSSYTPDYFSIEDILATQERLPVEVTEDLPDIGFLDPGSENNDLKKGTKMELPFWMVDGMKSGSRDYISVEVTKTYKEIYREIMAADPLVLDLHKLGPYYYEFGRHLMKHSQAQGEAIGECISNTFKSRFTMIMDSAQNASDTDTLKETQRMDQLERILYSQGQTCKTGMEEWLTRKTGLISTSFMVEQHRKRKANFE